MPVNIEINLNRRSMSWPRILRNKAIPIRGGKAIHPFLVKASMRETPVEVRHNGLKIAPSDYAPRSGYDNRLFRAGVTRINITQVDPDQIEIILNACTDHGINGMKRALKANGASLSIKDRTAFPITFKDMLPSKFKGLLKTISDCFTLKKYLRLDDPDNFPRKKTRNLAEDTLAALIRLAQHNDKAVLAYFSALSDVQIRYLDKYIQGLKTFEKTHHLFPRFIRDLASPVGFGTKLFFTHHINVTLPVSPKEKLARQKVIAAFKQAQEFKQKP